jgi:hypothetical protein
MADGTSTTTSGAVSTSTSGEASPNRPDAVDRLQEALAAWRSRLDELIVQLDLASMELRDALSSQLNAAENAGLALRSGLTYAGEDVAGGLAGPRDTIATVLEDLHSAVESAKRAVREARR